MEKFYSSKTLLKMVGENVGCARSICPTSPSGCIVTKDGLKFKRYICFRLKIPKAVKHDCCKEVKGMLSGETGKTIFKC